MSEGVNRKVTKTHVAMLNAKMEDGLYTLAGSTITIVGFVNTSTV